MRRVNARCALPVVVLVIAAAPTTPVHAALPEFLPATFPVTLSGASGKALFEEESGAAWLYSSGTIGGEVTGVKSLGKTTLTFLEGRNGCDKAGTLTWSGLVGRIGYISKEAHTVGLALESPTQPFALCNFLGIEGKAYGGSIVGKLTPVNKPTKELTLTFTQSKGVQELSKLEGETAFPLVKGQCKFELKEKPFELKCVGLESTTRVGVEATVTIKTTKEVEVRA